MKTVWPAAVYDKFVEIVTASGGLISGAMYVNMPRGDGMPKKDQCGCAYGAAGYELVERDLIPQVCAIVERLDSMAPAPAAFGKLERFLYEYSPYYGINTRIPTDAIPNDTIAWWLRHSGIGYVDSDRVVNDVSASGRLTNRRVTAQEWLNEAEITRGEE